MSNALDGAYAKIERAKEVLVELRKLNDLVCKKQADDTVVTSVRNVVVPPGEIRQVLAVDNSLHIDIPVPIRCAVLAGEVANGLRSALNYLVRQLAILDSGSPGQRNQFPVEATPEAFKGNCFGRRGFLAGLSDEHVAAIEALQPFNGCKWIGPLSTISNFDKHTDTLVVQRDQLLSVEAVPKLDLSGAVVAHEVSIAVLPSLRIALPDGMPLMETLEEISVQVPKLLDEFKLNFN